MNPKSDHRHPGGNEDMFLCREVLSGNMSSFSVLAEKYRRRIFSLGMGFFKNPDDAEDFVQDVLVKVYISLASFRFESQFSTWLMRIAYNTAINSIKRKKEYTSLAEDYEIADPDENPEEEHLKACSCEAIREAIKILPEKYRICVDMFFFYDMPYADISEVTGLPVNTIKSHVFRAKKLLREYLNEGEQK
ncbi:RNA polymerase sigma factor [Brucepastera parasyntrophica]|uniref:RNA polymerase sigma factor n=1 Tax=Brucepastera parasyntrophica TaxID=2880008 RepID=UPI00210B68A2|nr:RNA polymerase sigma factor [Brucepastera parasyntrophica]ULQ58720.1 RNA polymerase sigma factor [Brucepastera parasyntrophica]